MGNSRNLDKYIKKYKPRVEVNMDTETRVHTPFKFKPRKQKKQDLNIELNELRQNGEID